MANAFKHLHKILSTIVGSDKEVTATESAGKVGLDVNVLNPGGVSSGTLVNSYNEITTVAAASETTITSYTVPALTTAYLQIVEASGTNIADYKVKLNGSTIARKYTNFGSELSVNFNFTNSSGLSGVVLAAGDIITVTVIHNRGATGNFNSNILAVEA